MNRQIAFQTFKPSILKSPVRCMSLSFSTYLWHQSFFLFYREKGTTDLTTSIDWLLPCDRWRLVTRPWKEHEFSSNAFSGRSALTNVLFIIHTLFFFSPDCSATFAVLPFHLRIETRRDARRRRWKRELTSFALRHELILTFSISLTSSMKQSSVIFCCFCYSNDLRLSSAFKVIYKEKRSIGGESFYHWSRLLINFRPTISHGRLSAQFHFAQLLFDNESSCFAWISVIRAKQLVIEKWQL